jgi:hypothetical protein
MSTTCEIFGDGGSTMETLVKFSHFTYLFQAMETFVRDLKHWNVDAYLVWSYNKIVLYVVRSVFFAKKPWKDNLIFYYLPFI